MRVVVEGSQNTGMAQRAEMGLIEGNNVKCFAHVGGIGMWSFRQGGKTSPFSIENRLFERSMNALHMARGLR
jgi:hypothetical protein